MLALEGDKSQYLVQRKNRNATNQIFVPASLGSNVMAYNVYVFKLKSDENRAVTSSAKSLGLEKFSSSNLNQQFRLLNNFDGSFRIQSVKSSNFLEASLVNADIFEAGETNNDSQSFYFDALE
jgi:hypothetical protein